MNKLSQREVAERLVETYSDLILRLCWTYLKNTQDAEDICQNTFVKLLCGNVHFTSPEHEKAWIIRTASNECKDLLKSAHRSRTCALDACGDYAVPEAENEGSVLAAVAQLPESYREVLYLHYFEGYSLKEIGALLNIPAATAGTRLARGREKLKAILEGEYYEHCI